MPCYTPLSGYRAKAPGKSGGFGIVFDRSLSHGQHMSVGCGQCIGCRLDYSKMWAMRCMHEAALHADNCFITLTYCDESLPSGHSLVKWHFTDFMKRLRREYHGSRIRYYMCGEYGDQFSRPHYHACLFGFDFPDKEFYAKPNGFALYTSDSLAERWGHGFCTVGELSYETAAYTARYIMKKVTGDMAHAHYMVVDPDTGEIYFVEPEYCTMSRRPGIARDWFEEFGSDVFPSDEVIINGKVCKPPRFYSDILQLDSPESYERLKRKRSDWFGLHSGDCTPRRLRDRETVARARVDSLKRSFDHGS